VVGNSVGRARIGACRCQVGLDRSEYRLCELWEGVSVIYDPAIRKSNWLIPPPVIVTHGGLVNLREDQCINLRQERRTYSNGYSMWCNRTYGALLCCHDKAFSIYYNVYSEICPSTTQRELIFAFPWQQLFRERAAVLRSTCIICLFHEC